MQRHGAMSQTIWKEKGAARLTKEQELRETATMAASKLAKPASTAFHHAAG